MNTASTLPIENLSVADKLLLMERLWAELPRRAADIPSPDWYGDVLAEREAAVREGRTAFVEWDGAKQRLRERFKLKFGSCLRPNETLKLERTSTNLRV